jgi:hypothetical protein
MDLYGEQFNSLLVLSHLKYSSYVHKLVRKNILTHGKKLILVGVGAMWLSRNDMVFNKTPICSFIQVIYRGMH